MSDMGPEPKPPGKGTGRYATKGAEASQEARLAGLEAAIQDLDARVDALENPPEPA